MAVKDRREREKLETRELILEAARELFATEGYEGVSMRKVAERIDYSATAIYVHFPDKEALLKELCHQDFANLAQAFQGMAMVDDPIQRIREIGRAYIQFGAQNPNHYKLMFMTPHPRPELDAIDVMLIGNPEVDAYAFLKNTVQEAMDRGVFRDELTDAELITQTLWAAVHGVISLEIAKCHDPWVDWRPLAQRADLMLDAILRGLQKEPE